MIIETIIGKAVFAKAMALHAAAVKGAAVHGAAGSGLVAHSAVAGTAAHGASHAVATHVTVKGVDAAIRGIGALSAATGVVVATPPLLTHGTSASPSLHQAIATGKQLAKSLVSSEVKQQLKSPEVRARAKAALAARFTERRSSRATHSSRSSSGIA